MGHKTLGLLLMAVAFLFAVWETNKFKNNFLPETPVEIMYDLISLALFCIGFILVIAKRKK